MLRSILFFSLTLILFLQANDTNKTKDHTKDNNSTKIKKIDTNTTKKDLAKKYLEQQIKKEAKYAKEKMFYMGKDYNLSEHEVDPNSLKHIKAIEPDYDFDMDEGVYSD